MPDFLPLFDSAPENPAGGFDRNQVARKLQQLAEQNILIGGSSWKYEGWLGQIYTPERYFSRGKFSRKKFEQECLAEYAEVFPIVCGDFSFYQFPAPEFWQKLFASAPDKLRFAFKVPEEVTVRVFPFHPRYGDKAGLQNPLFLNADLFQQNFASVLEPYRDRVAVLIFEFGSFSKAAYDGPDEFCADLHRFLSLLPDSFRYAVEIRNQEFLVPEYFRALTDHEVAHVFNAWTRMPPLDAQIQIPEAFTTDFSVSRALLRSGRPYERAVEMFSPYREAKDPNLETRTALKDLIERARRRREPAYLFINNRLEGNAPVTIQAVLDEEEASEDASGRP